MKWEKFETYGKCPCLDCKTHLHLVFLTRLKFSSGWGRDWKEDSWAFQAKSRQVVLHQKCMNFWWKLASFSISATHSSFLQGVSWHIDGICPPILRKIFSKAKLQTHAELLTCKQVHFSPTLDSDKPDASWGKSYLRTWVEERELYGIFLQGHRGKKMPHVPNWNDTPLTALIDYS